MWIEIILPHTRNVLLCALYRPPSEKVEWRNHFIQMIRKPLDCFKDIVIIGDFNIDLSQNGRDKKWKNICGTYKLHQMVTKPTRETHTSSKIIDHIYTTNKGMVKSVTVPHIRLSDHFPVYFSWQFDAPESKEERLIQGSIGVNKMNTFRRVLSDECLWDPVLKEEDTDEALKKGQLIAQGVPNTHVQCEDKISKQKYPPRWFNDEIKEAIRLRDSTPLNKPSLIHERSQDVTSLFKESKKNFFMEELKKKEDPEGIMEVFGTIFPKNTGLQNRSDPVCLLNNNEKVFDTTEIANLFNAFFTPEAVYNDDWIDDSYLTTLEQSILTGKRFEIRKVDKTYVLKVLENLNGSEATDLDEVLANLPRESRNQTDHYVKHINTSIESNVFPSSWKEVKLIPILKSNESPLHVSNYTSRPILSHLSKVLERHVYSELNKYLVDNNLQRIMQYTCKFHEEHLLEAALIKVIDKWMGDIDKGYLVGCVFVNFSQAYDLVDHKILLRKLKIYGLSENSMEWFNSYLTGRQQCTFVNSTLSDPKTVNCGLPKESILGFLLFIIFLQDMIMHVQHCSVEMFENVLIFYVSDESIGGLNKKLNEDMACITKWFKSNKMVINADKMESMLICSRQRRDARGDQRLIVTVDNATLQNVTSKTLFNVEVDYNLTWHTHVNNICKIVSNRLNELKHNKDLIDEDTINLYYNYYVLPILDYCSLVWGTCNKGDIERLTDLQKQVARKSGSKNKSPAGLFEVLKSQPIDKLIRAKRLIMVHKSLNGLAPQCLIGMFQYTENIHDHGLRSTTSHKLYLNNARSEYGKNRFSYRGAEEWNKLPLECRNAPTVEDFKQQLYKVK